MLQMIDMQYLGTISKVSYHIYLNFGFSVVYHFRLWGSGYGHTNPHTNENPALKIYFKPIIIMIDGTQMDSMLKLDVLPCFPLWGINWFFSSAKLRTKMPSGKSLRKV